MAVLIGLAIIVKLRRTLSYTPFPRLRVQILPGSHNNEVIINRQLADKERVAAAMENPSLMAAVNTCLTPPEQLEMDIEAQMAELMAEDGEEEEGT